jgi:hypothetical protein
VKEFGWAPLVVTITDEHVSGRDESRLAGLDGVAVSKAKPARSLSELYLAIKRLVAPAREPAAMPPIQSVAASPNSPRPETRTRALRRYMLSLMVLPDAERVWICPAARTAIKEIRRRRASCIVTSCPPYSVHVAGLIVHAFTGVRWVADFRDPWMSGGRKSLFATSRLSLAIDRWLERQVVERADVIVANTRKLCASLRAAYPHLPESKFVMVPNSIDVSRLADLRAMPKDPVFTITYTGSLYFNRSPEPLFRAVRQLLDGGALQRPDLRIALTGQCDRVGDVATTELIRRYELEGMVTVSEPIAYGAALELVRRSHLALLLAPTQPNQIPAKAYDYIGAGTEILAIAGPGATADLIEEAAAGAVYGEADVAGIAEFVRRTIERRRASGDPAPQSVQQFDARLQAERLANLFVTETVLGKSTEVAVS